MFLAQLDDLPSNLLAASDLLDLAQGDILYHRGDPAQAVHVVLYGRLKLFTYTTEGKLVPLYVVRSGECVSEAALFADIYCSDVLAEVPSRVCAFPRKELQQALIDHPQFAAEFMESQARKFNKVRVSLELRALRSARERILQFVQSASPQEPKMVRMDRPLKSVAEDLNLSPESFYRTLTQLIEEGSIIRTKGTLRLREKKR